MRLDDVIKNIDIMQPMRIEFQHPGNGRSTVNSPSMAMMHFAMHHRPRQEIIDPESFKVYQVGPPMPGDTSRLLLPLVYSIIERQHDISPPINIIVPDKSDNGGRQYQMTCLQVLWWLASQGYVNDLRIEADRPNTLDDLRRICPDIFDR